MQGLSDEQKVVLIRRELPRCSAEEALNSLEACAGDVDAALAIMAQVLLTFWTHSCVCCAALQATLPVGWYAVCQQCQGSCGTPVTGEVL